MQHECPKRAAQHCSTGHSPTTCAKQSTQGNDTEDNKGMVLHPRKTDPRRHQSPEGEVLVPQTLPTICAKLRVHLGQFTSLATFQETCCLLLTAPLVHLNTQSANYPGHVCAAPGRGCACRRRGRTDFGKARHIRT